MNLTRQIIMKKPRKYYLQIFVQKNSNQKKNQKNTKTKEGKN
jgi:hypothetical protein